MAAILDHPATMSSYLHLLTSGMQQYGHGGADATANLLDDWDPASFLQEDGNQHDQAAGADFGDDYMYSEEDDEGTAVHAATPDAAGVNVLQAASGLSNSSWGAVTEADSAGILVAIGDGGGSKRAKKEEGSGAAASRYRKRIGFRTKSEVDVLDDGYKWRKYGKKSVKNSPNPRNYYKCSCQSCNVKKRVERDGEDPSYVLTIYEGVHNHASPSSVASIRYTIDNNSTLCGNSAAAGSISLSPWLSSASGTTGWASSGSNGWGQMNSADVGQFSFS